MRNASRCKALLELGIRVSDFFGYVIYQLPSEQNETTRNDFKEYSINEIFTIEISAQRMTLDGQRS